MFSTLGWCSEKAIQTPLENMTKGQLDQNLRRFYAEARTQKGEPYNSAWVQTRNRKISQRSSSQQRASASKSPHIFPVKPDVRCATC